MYRCALIHAVRALKENQKSRTGPPHLETARCEKVTAIRALMCCRPGRVGLVDRVPCLGQSDGTNPEGSFVLVRTQNLEGFRVGCLITRVGRVLLDGV